MPAIKSKPDMTKQKPLGSVQIPSNKQLRCFIRPGDNGYYAHCIDWNLLAHEPTVEEAKKAIEDQIMLYLSSLADHNFPEQMMDRRAPWNEFVQYYLIAIMCRLFGAIKRVRDSYQIISETPHLSPM